MQITAALDLIKNKQLAPLLKVYGMLTPFYRLGYIAALANTGCLQILKNGPAALDELAASLGIASEHRDGLRAWLQVGVRLDEISLENGRYALSGAARELAEAAQNDALLALTEEVAALHHQLILKTPAQLQTGRPWTLNDQDGALIARSSRILEPLQNEVIATLYPKDAAVRLLEVGCGSGIYIRQAARNNPRLTAVGVELQAAVAAMARQNLAEWGLADQVVIETRDIRTKSFHAEFDLATLYNNIYYFPVGERPALLQHLRGCLKAGGRLIVTTGCQGGTLAMELLNLWGATTQGCDRLPDADELAAQMESAGFEQIRKRNLLPGDAFYVFSGVRPA